MDLSRIHYREMSWIDFKRVSSLLASAAGKILAGDADAYAERRLAMRELVFASTNITSGDPLTDAELRFVFERAYEAQRSERWAEVFPLAPLATMN